MVNPLSANFESEMNRKFKLTEEKALLKKEIEKLSLQERALSTALKDATPQTCNPTSTKIPLILGTAHRRMSILNFGKVSKDPFYHNSTIIYPIGYTSKRRYRKFSSTPSTDNIEAEPKENKTFYICTVVEKPYLFDIKSSENDKWVGMDAWDKFKADLNILEYNSIEEFYGLNNPIVQSKIEESFDISQLENYIPLSKRGFRKNGV